MSGLPELIDHLARHEGGALGALPVALRVDGQLRRTGISVDDFLAYLRALADGRKAPAAITLSGDGVSVTVTSRAGEVVELVEVLGFHTELACIGIDARPVGDA